MKTNKKTTKPKLNHALHEQSFIASKPLPEIILHDTSVAAASAAIREAVKRHNETPHAAKPTLVVDEIHFDFHVLSADMSRFLTQEEIRGEIKRKLQAFRQQQRERSEILRAVKIRARSRVETAHGLHCKVHLGAGVEGNLSLMKSTFPELFASDVSTGGVK